MKVKLIIPGKPLGKQRPVFNSVTKEARTPEKTLNYENLAAWIYKTEIHHVFEGPIEMEITAYYEIQSSGSKKMKQEKVAGIIRPTIKPDIDNICKIICDGLNKIAYHDDSSIVKITAEKYYSEEPRVEVIIKDLGE